LSEFEIKICMSTSVTSSSLKSVSRSGLTECYLFKTSRYTPLRCVTRSDGISNKLQTKKASGIPEAF